MGKRVTSFLLLIAFYCHYKISLEEVSNCDSHSFENKSKLFKFNLLVYPPTKIVGM